ncbi:hypothetical protein [Paenibacillus beijingensis]|uniref:N-acetyltransferase domain-containing protein n=1 Tax=Paenibacillus beijingensis TaxID=1126833 RepID=A0A0D5NKY8_9BACL|nr:hypothetical protein [Paenibacillus beijingensis]AJY75647.1 hypothetical protein VN24_15120 [Paenibacillus beijingensis]
MLTLECVSSDNFAVECTILNSNAFFNRISRDKETLDEDDVSADRKDAEKAGAERFLIKDGETYVGVASFRLGVLIENEPGLKFWRRNGFRKVGSSALPDGKGIEVYESA